MYVRVTTVTFDPARKAQVLQLIDDSMIPAIKQMPGFVSYTGATNDEEGKGVAISVWNDLEHAAALRDALGGLIQEFEARGVGFEPAQLFEIDRHVAG